MGAQNFKGDAIEQKMRAAGEPALDFTSLALDDFYEGGANSAAFILSLYDQGRLPFSQRIDRDVFVAFFQKAYENFPFIGSFESYIFILKEIFGAESEILFEVPAPGKLNISVNAVADVVYDAVVRELISSSAYDFFTLATLDNEDIVFRGIAGIETEYELGLLFAEIMPAGIYPTISLEFFTKSTFIGEDGDGVYDVTDNNTNQIVFIEIGG